MDRREWTPAAIRFLGSPSLLFRSHFFLELSMIGVLSTRRLRLLRSGFVGFFALVVKRQSRMRSNSLFLSAIS